MNYITKDSGKRITYKNGSTRDTREGKGRYDLIPRCSLHRLAQLYERGAVKYGENNWRLGVPSSRFLDSLIRHAYQYLDGARDEDHLAAIAWNAFGIMFNEMENKKWHDLKPKGKR